MVHTRLIPRLSYLFDWKCVLTSIQSCVCTYLGARCLNACGDVDDDDECHSSSILNVKFTVNNVNGSVLMAYVQTL